MKIFIDDVPVYLVPMENSLDREHYDHIIDASKEQLRFDELIDDVLIRKSDIKQIMKFYEFQCKDNNKKLDSLTFKVNDYDDTVKHFKNEFKIVKAAGGIVTKDEKILFIFRLNKWDLPKGKLEKKEHFAEAAIREVEEECNVQVILNERVCKTWHTYTRNGKNHLKKTEWYKMKLVSDKNMKPQLSEGIEKLIWIGQDELRAVLLKSYRSIRYVLKKFHEHEEWLT